MRTKVIITSLVFDHALRIRLKAEVAEKKDAAQPSAAPTPNSASVAWPKHPPLYSDEQHSVASPQHGRWSELMDSFATQGTHAGHVRLQQGRENAPFRRLFHCPT